MRTIKFSLVLISLILYLIVGSVLRLTLFWTNPYTRIKALNRLTYGLMHLFKMIGGFRITISGEKGILKEKGIFIINTHVGYIDGIVLGTLVPGSFTTKSEIKNSPLLGKVVAVGQSIFINRQEKNHIINYVNVMTDRLNNGINVFNFPEGHASDGKQILPFFPAFFDAPLKSRSPIVPITIDYKKVNGSDNFDRSGVYCYDGKTSIIKHLWNLLKFKSIDIRVTIHDKIQPNGHRADSKGRKQISELCINRLAAFKNIPVSKTHPLKSASRLETKS